MKEGRCYRKEKRGFVDDVEVIDRKWWGCFGVVATIDWRGKFRVGVVGGVGRDGCSAGRSKKEESGIKNI